MKKIGILTFNRALNFGAILQTYALQTALKNNAKKFDITVINYKSKKIEENRKIVSNFSKNIFKSIVKILYSQNKKRRFDKFIKKFLNLSLRDYSLDNIDKMYSDYDIIITGSDQIWNYKITDCDFTYLLDNHFSNVKKISYAASLGVEEIDNSLLNKYIDCLNDYDSISVREGQTQKYLSNFVSKKIQVCLDPTLLLKKDDWEKIIKSNCNLKNKYILFYNVPSPSKIFEYSKKLSLSKGIQLVNITTGFRPNFGKSVYPNIIEFLSLFKNSEYVVTNSFHGTVFSIIFHKKMVVELKKSGFGNERIKTLLKICNLEDRIYKDNIDIDNEINWDVVDKKIDFERKKSIDFLLESIEKNMK